MIVYYVQYDCNDWPKGLIIKQSRLDEYCECFYSTLFANYLIYTNQRRFSHLFLRYSHEQYFYCRNFS